MSTSNPSHAQAAYLAVKHLPPYLGAWIAATLNTEHSLPPLIEHQDRLAADVRTFLERMDVRFTLHPLIGAATEEYTRATRKYSPEHDDTSGPFRLRFLAAGYLTSRADMSHKVHSMPLLKRLTRAAALLMAEWDRHERAVARESEEEQS